MNKIKLSLGMLLVGTAFLAGNFVGCKSSSPANPTGGGGSGGGGSGAVDSGMTATLPDGNCAVMAYPHMGVCACQDNVPTVCNGTCVDTKSDPDNCGACGMKCASTSACAAGTCTTAVTAVLPAVTGCTALTLTSAGGSLYYADEGHGTINKVGTATALVTGEMGPTWLAANGANLFWYNKGTKKIRKAAATGGAAADVYANTAMGADGGAAPEVGSFLVTPDGMSIYVALGVDVIKLPVAGGTPTVVVHEFKGGVPGAMALNGTTNLVFPTGLNVDVDAPLLSAMPAICGDDTKPALMGEDDMTTCPRLGRSQGSLLMTFMAVISGRAFWTSEAEVRSEMIGTVGTTYDPVSSAANPITAAAVSTDTIYFGSYDITTPNSGMIQKAPAAVNANNAPPISLARGQATPTSLAVDATKVYWSASDCTISSLPK